jgi:hypothetical protein
MDVQRRRKLEQLNEFIERCWRRSGCVTRDPNQQKIKSHHPWALKQWNGREPSALALGCRGRLSIDLTRKLSILELVSCQTLLGLVKGGSPFISGSRVMYVHQQRDKKKEEPTRTRGAERA